MIKKQEHQTSLLNLNQSEKEILDYWSRIISKAGTKGFLKGGFIRDKIANRIRLLDLNVNDIDFLVIDKINRVAEFAIKNGATMIERRSRKGIPVFRFLVPRYPEVSFEVGVAMAEALAYDRPTFDRIRENDILSTDLDVDSMTVKLPFEDNNIYDPLKGLDAIKKGYVSLVDWHSLYRNPENILRAVRIADRINCELSVQTINILREHSCVVKRIKRPFLDSQLSPILKSSNSPKLWQQLTDLGVVSNLLNNEIKDLEQARTMFAC